MTAETLVVGWGCLGGGATVGGVLPARLLRCLGAPGGDGGLEGGPRLGDAPTTHFAGGFVDPPRRRAVEEGELSCHVLQSTQGV